MIKKSAVKKTNSDTKVFIILIFLILIFGVVMIYDSTIIHSQLVYNNPYRFVLQHLGWVVIGISAYLFFLKIDYTKLQFFSYVFFAVSLLMLGILAFLSLIPCENSLVFAPCLNGANRWLYINPQPLPEIPLLGVVGFQPSELAKLSLILYLSFQLYLNIQRKENLFSVYLISTLLVSGLVIVQPNMSTSIIIFVIGTVVYFSSGASLKKLLAVMPVIMLFALLFMLSSSYRRNRILTLVSSGEGNSLESSYHINQVSIALGSGGFWGLGFGQSRQKYQYLPEVASDSIFAIIGEEFGYLGATLFMAVFLYFIYKGLKIGLKSSNLLGKMISSGIISWIGIQFFINIAAMSRLIPLTGVPIPLISYGGSSLIFSMIGLGIITNIGLSDE